MAVFQRCCRRWFSLSRTHCSRCGELLSAKRQKTYAVDVYQGIGRRRIVVGSNKARALEYDEHQRVKAREGRLDPVPVPVPFSELTEMYLDRAVGTTSERTAKCIFRRLSREWGDLRTDQITPAMIEGFRSQLLREGKSRGWIDQHTALGRSAYNLAHLPNPFAKIKQFSPDTRVVRWLTHEERIRLLAEMKFSPPHLRQMIMVAMESGLRQRSIFQLRRDEVDFERGIIRVRVSAKGGRFHMVPMSRTLSLILKELGEGNSPYFWISPRTGKPYTDVNTAWRSLKKRAGITRTFRWHDLRHDFLSRVVTATGSLRIAQELAGHSDPKMTMRYAHLIDDSARRAVEVISDLLVTQALPPSETQDK